MRGGRGRKSGGRRAEGGERRAEGGERRAESGGRRVGDGSRLLQRSGIMQKGLGAGLAYYGTRMVEGLRNSEVGIRNSERENTGFGGGGGGDFAMGVGTWGDFCAGRGEVGFLHKSPRWRRKRVAKLEFAGDRLDEETGEICAAGLGIERHPLL